jgi:hypothetical protein
VGLLDSLFDSSTYGGQNGGLLDLLRNIQMQQAGEPKGQGGGFPGQPFTPPPSQVPPLPPAQTVTTPPQPPALPQNVAQAYAQAPQEQPQQQLPPALGGNQPGGIANNLMAGFQGLANAGSPIQAIGNLIGGLATGQRTDPAGIAQQNLKAQYDSLVPMLGPQKALLAVMNPEAGKTLLTEALTNKEKYGVIRENPIEGRKYGFINERDLTINGKPIGQGEGQSSPGLLAPGVTSYNPSLSGEQYLAQFSPEVQAATKAYIRGDVLPSGNPRQQGIASMAKTVAQKYGADMGIPVSDALYAEKRKYWTELGSNSANSAGGQAKAFNQGISHLTSLADNLEKLDNSNGLGIPWLAQGANAVRQGVSNDQAAIADEAKSLGQTVAGEVGKLFSGSSGGGVHERELTRERFDTVKSKPQLAAALRATIETMQGGLSALEQNRDRILGQNSGVDFVSDQTKANIAKIQGVIDRLESGASPKPASSGLPSGWSVKVH